MTTGSYSDQEVGDILAHFADVIEGGNAYRGGGTACNGIPGTDAVGDELPMAITATANGTTTTVTDSSRTWVDSDRWSKTDMLPHYLVCSSATNTANVGVGRKISAWTLATKKFTTAAFPSATTLGDTFDIRQGFRRIRDGVDIEADDESVPDGYDRVFQLDVGPGRFEPVHGRGVDRFRGELVLRLRLLKRHRLHTSRARALSNIARLRTLVPRPEHLDGTYVRALWSEDPPVFVTDDPKKLVVEVRFVMIYAINANME